MDHEQTLRLGFFFGAFAVIALWEILSPRRPLTTSKTRRWANNLSLVVINTLILRAIFPTAAVGLALLSEENHWGLLNNYTVPQPWTVILAVILMDFCIYLQHVIFHAIPLLWRLHMIHHTDLDYDVTTGLRFHPVEIILSMLIKFAVIAVLGPSATAVIIFEIMLNACAMFNHGNIRLPVAVDRIVRLFLVTPDMHRVHHSAIKRETNSNYGFNLPWWDRLFGTYRAQPQLGHDKMVIGLNQYREEDALTLPKLIVLPLKARVGEYPINRDKP